ncbi:hypothetical protein [Spirosoma sp.]|uniref:DUF7674 family protein n=1 Tax=Spirosoma sp. TaxID=1899569 RepID=UPI00261362FA|nr:hypothetical protein [Spirosoma sp.]MCX6219080.1 hypothetical protein [Spirosoma sp.]
MAYTQENCMDEVLKAVPGFQERWQEHVDYWEGEPAGLVLDMIELAAYTNEQLENKENNDLEAIFQLMENMLNTGSDEVKNAVATGFLESVINPVTADTEYLPLLTTLLGEKSRAYCREWLSFSGAQLPDLSA